jgi:hypothetical protein
VSGAAPSVAKAEPVRKVAVDQLDVHVAADVLEVDAAADPGTSQSQAVRVDILDQPAADEVTDHRRRDRASVAP